MSASEAIPAPITEQERWICENHVCALRVEHRMTGSDTADTYVHLTPTSGEPVCWLDRTFRKVARLDLTHIAVAVPAYGVADRVKARLEFERKNAKDLAEYKRLKAKFDPH